MQLHIFYMTGPVRSTVYTWCTSRCNFGIVIKLQIPSKDEVSTEMATVIWCPPTSLTTSFQVLICFAGSHPSTTVVVRTESDSLVALKFVIRCVRALPQYPSLLRIGFWWSLSGSRPCLNPSGQASTPHFCNFRSHARFPLFSHKYSRRKEWDAKHNVVEMLFSVLVVWTSSSFTEGYSRSHWWKFLKCKDKGKP